MQLSAYTCTVVIPVNYNGKSFALEYIRLTLLLRYSVGKNTSRRQRPSLPQYEFGKPELEVIFK